MSNETPASRADGTVPALVRHGVGENAEYMLCGLAFDEPDDDGHPLVTATARQEVTCPNCRAAIDHIRRTFCGYRYVPNASGQRAGGSRYAEPSCSPGGPTC